MDSPNATGRRLPYFTKVDSLTKPSKAEQGSLQAPIGTTMITAASNHYHVATRIANKHNRNTIINVPKQCPAPHPHTPSEKGTQPPGFSLSGKRRATCIAKQAMHIRAPRPSKKATGGDAATAGRRGWLCTSRIHVASPARRRPPLCSYERSQQPAATVFFFQIYLAKDDPADVTVVQGVCIDLAISLAGGASERAAESRESK